MNTLRSETCVCGSVHWHSLVSKDVVWCRRCGAARTIFGGLWMIPLDRAGEVSLTKGEEEIPTRPDLKKPR